MKIDSKISGQLLYRGSVESSTRQINEQEKQRLSEAVNKEPSVKSGFEKKGFNLDVKG